MLRRLLLALLLLVCGLTAAWVARASENTPARSAAVPTAATRPAPKPAPKPARARAAAERHPPVVVLMFDEFTYEALLDKRMRIDPVLFPHLAALAGQANVYSNFTAPGDETGPMTVSLLAGRRYDPRAQPNYASAKRNLFTLFARTYRPVVREEATDLCPTRICPGNGAPRSAKDVLHYLGGGRVERYRSWLSTIKATPRPTLWFKHLLLPHGPLTYNPGGRRYNPHSYEEIPGLNRPPSFGDPWFVRQAWQRYAMHVRLVDTLVGELVARLRAEKLYDRSLLVLTADNGEAFGHAGSDPHQIDARTALEVASTPLIVKLPQQRKGSYVRRHVRVFDLLAGLAAVAHVPIGRTYGQNFLGAGARRIPSQVVAYSRGKKRFSWSLATYEKLLRAAVARRVGVFGQGAAGVDGLYAIGPRPELVGRRAADVATQTASGLRFVLQDPARYGLVTGGSALLPTHVIGRLTGPGARRGLAVAVVVDGVVRTTARTARTTASKAVWVSAFLPESALPAGRHTVQLLLLRGGAALHVKRG